jgi:hypothetical protein
LNTFFASDKWVAQISIACKRTHLGYFATEYEAALRYDVKAQELGRPLNFPSNSEQGTAEQATKVNALIVGPSIDFTKGPYKKQKKVRADPSNHQLPWGIGNGYDLPITLNRVMSMSSQTDFNYTCLPPQVPPSPLVKLPSTHHQPPQPTAPSLHRRMPMMKVQRHMPPQQEEMIFQFNPQPLDAEKIMKALRQQQAGESHLDSQAEFQSRSRVESHHSSQAEKAKPMPSSSASNEYPPPQKNSSGASSSTLDSMGNSVNATATSNDPFADSPASNTATSKFNDLAVPRSITRI